MATLSEYIKFLRDSNHIVEADFWAKEVVKTLASTDGLTEEQILALPTEEIMPRIFKAIDEQTKVLETEVSKLKGKMGTE